MPIKRGNALWAAYNPDLEKMIETINTSYICDVITLTNQQPGSIQWFYFENVQKIGVTNVNRTRTSCRKGAPLSRPAKGGQCPLNAPDRPAVSLADVFLDKTV